MEIKFLSQLRVWENTNIRQTNIVLIPPQCFHLVVVLALIITVYVMLVFNTGQQTVLSYSRRSSYVNAGFAPLSAPTGNNDQKGLLSEWKLQL